MMKGTYSTLFEAVVYDNELIAKLDKIKEFETTLELIDQLTSQIANLDRLLSESGQRDAHDSLRELREQLLGTRRRLSHSLYETVMAE